MRTFGETEDDGRKDQDFTYAKRDPPILVLNTRSYLNTSGVVSGLTLLLVGRICLLSDFTGFSLSLILCLAVF